MDASDLRQSRARTLLDNKSVLTSAWRMVSVQEITLVKPAMVGGAFRSTLDQYLLISPSHREHGLECRPKEQPTIERGGQRGTWG
jgi:hypothetical protein